MNSIYSFYKSTRIFFFFLSINLIYLYDGYLLYNNFLCIQIVQAFGRCTSGQFEFKLFCVVILFFFCLRRVCIFICIQKFSIYIYHYHIVTSIILSVIYALNHFFYVFRPYYLDVFIDV